MLNRLISTVKWIPMLVAVLMASGGVMFAVAHTAVRCGVSLTLWESTDEVVGGLKGDALFLSIFSITPWLLGISINFPAWTNIEWFKWQWAHWDGNTRLMAVYGVCVLLFGLAVIADIVIPLQ